MTASGVAKINEAKKDGSWSAIDAIEAHQMPWVLTKAFSRNKKALRNFEAFPPGVKKQLYHWVISAKQESTQNARIREIITKAAKNERANRWVKK